MAVPKYKTDAKRVETERPVYEPRPVRGEVDYEALRKEVMAQISKTREYLAR